ncbi:MAG TPA: restriction endonuclease subunit S, partial [Mariprofundaceae bacterium]|nr:restriction endonuclease subunit S [Mariprofundaceae bacterium]
MPVNIPCYQEQQEIADFLSAIDNKIEQVGAQLEQAKAFKKGLLQQMFV